MKATITKVIKLEFYKAVLKTTTTLTVVNARLTITEYLYLHILFFLGMNKKTLCH